MKGKLFNAANGWIMSYKSEIDGTTKMIPLHPTDVNEGGGYNWNLVAKEGKESEFEIVNECAKLIEIVEPTTTPYVSDDFQIGPEGAYENEDKGWDKIFEIWVKHQSYSKTTDGLQEFLEKNYLPPYKK